ncbi:actin family [Cantharellus anzutake]|uniref:actin family n=1 Tax=Cantharellus anzutake TaxID=1750568 RepID=UPI0019056481|nr:actin family [Cantharellus anzutake]KAF8340324.1 actin family [Cantharellus anzutake]
METPATPTVSRIAVPTPSASQIPSPHYATTRRHSLYGTEDRVVIDPGSRVWKVGFSGEGRPREVFVTVGGKDGTSLWSSSSQGNKSNSEREEDQIILSHRLQDILRSIFFDSLLTDPRSRKVILVEHPMLQLAVKEALAQVMFENLQIPSISFAPSHVLAMMAAGRLTGLVLDCGYLESTVVPIYGSRPLYSAMRTSPLAGARLNTHLRSLLMLFGTYLGPMGVVGQNPKPSAVPEDALPESIIEDMKTRCCFVGSPILLSRSLPRLQGPSESAATEDLMSVDQSETSTDVDPGQPSSQSRTSDSSMTGPSTQIHAMKDLYVRHSTATDLNVKIPAPGMAPTGPGTTTFTRASLLVPGWIRERAAELLFEDGDVDEASVAEVILDSLLKVPVDLRKEFASSIVVAGGTCMLPGFIPRLQAELIRLLSPPLRNTLNVDDPAVTEASHPPSKLSPPIYDVYAPLRPLSPHIAILNNPDPPATQSTLARAHAGRAPAFAPAALQWIGASLAGAMKTGGEEITREKWDEALEDVFENTPSAPVPVSPGSAGSNPRKGFIIPDWTRIPLSQGAPSVHTPA